MKLLWLIYLYKNFCVKCDDLLNIEFNKVLEIIKKNFV